MNTCFLFLASVIAAPSPLHIDKLKIDCGEVRATKPLVQRVQLKNASSETMTITEVVGSCGCMRRELKSTELAAGASTELSIVLNLLPAPEGLNSWRATVRYRIGEHFGEQTIQLTAKVIKEIVVEPVSLFLSTEKETSASISITDRRAKPIKITGVRIGVKNVTGEVSTEKAGVRTQQVKITVPDSCPTGNHIDEVCLDTDDPDCPELRIPLRIVKKAANQGVSAFPSSGLVRFARDQESGSTMIRLRDADGKEVAVESIETEHEAITTKWAAGPGTMATVRLNVDRSKVNAAGTTVVTVRLRSPTKETVLIPLSWTLP